MDNFDKFKLTAPGVPETPSEREQAISLARYVLLAESLGGGSGLSMAQQQVLARQLLRALGLSERG